MRSMTWLNRLGEVVVAEPVGGDEVLNAGSVGHAVEPVRLAGDQVEDAPRVLDRLVCNPRHVVEPRGLAEVLENVQRLVEREVPERAHPPQQRLPTARRQLMQETNRRHARHEPQSTIPNRQSRSPPQRRCLRLPSLPVSRDRQPGHPRHRARRVTPRGKKPMTDQPQGAGAPPQDSEAVTLGTGSQADPQKRLSLYRHAAVENASEYVTLMRLFTRTLLTDLSAAEAHEALLRLDPATTLTVDDVENRCRQLEQWGNLVRSIRDARVATVSEWLRSRSRYQVSTLGGRVHRQIDEVLSASDGAREVARELLGATVVTLQQILDRLDADDVDVDVEALAADVTTIFNNQRLFADSATDFYAFVQGRISRYDLGGAEYSAFKTMLLTYVDLISADVGRHAPAVADLLGQIEHRLDELLTLLDTMPGLTSTDTLTTERSPGRSREDWQALTSWYTGRNGRSGTAQLRSAAEQALGQLLTNAKRMLAPAGTGVSRRADLLRLARWFDAADTADCARIYDAAFGAYPSRHLVGGASEDDGRAGPATSWLDADPVDVPLSLRERGDRNARGRTSKVPDTAMAAAAVAAEAEKEHAANRAAAAVLIAAGDLHDAHVTPSARDLLLDRLAHLLAVHQSIEEPVSVTETDLGLMLTATPAATATVIHSTDGDLTVHDLALHVTPTARAAFGATSDVLAEEGTA